MIDMNRFAPECASAILKVSPFGIPSETRSPANQIVPVVPIFAPSTAAIAAGSGNAPACGTEKSFSQPQMLGENGFSSFQSDDIPAADFVGAHFTCDAEL